MYCKKCKGRVIVDRMFDKEAALELMCLMCGKRWMLDSKNAFARYLLKIEKEYLVGTATL